MKWREITEAQRVNLSREIQGPLEPSVPLSDSERYLLSVVSESLLSAIDSGELERITDYTGNYFVRPTTR